MLKLNKNKIKKIIWYSYKIYGYTFVIMCCFLMIQTFLTAYFFSPNKTVLVDINSMGEAHLEFIMILVFYPFLAMFMLHIIYGLKKDKNKKRGVEDLT